MTFLLLQPLYYELNPGSFRFDKVTWRWEGETKNETMKEMEEKNTESYETTQYL